MVPKDELNLNRSMGRDWLIKGFIVSFKKAFNDVLIYEQSV